MLRPGWHRTTWRSAFSLRPCVDSSGAALEWDREPRARGVGLLALTAGGSATFCWLTPCLITSPSPLPLIGRAYCSAGAHYKRGRCTGVAAAVVAWSPPETGTVGHDVQCSVLCSIKSCLAHVPVPALWSGAAPLSLWWVPLSPLQNLRKCVVPLRAQPSFPPDTMALFMSVCRSGEAGVVASVDVFAHFMWHKIADFIHRHLRGLLGAYILTRVTCLYIIRALAHGSLQIPGICTSTSR